MIRLPSLLLLALSTLCACDNDPGAGKVAASVSEPSPAPTPAAPAPSPSPPSTDPKAPTLGAAQYTFDQSNSQLAFVGAKLTGKHDGSFKLFQGTIQTAAGAIPGGSVNVEIDIDSLEADVPKLTTHLKSADLLDAARFPKAAFASSTITPAGTGDQFTVTGNFTLHGITKQIGFPASIRLQPGAVHAEAEFTINRNDFGIVYPGKPDDLIKDEVLIKLSIHATQKDLPIQAPAQ